MIIVAIGAVSMALLNGANWGWASGRIIACWVTAVVATVAFVISSNRSEAPVVDPKLFRSRVFTSANLAIVVAATIFGLRLLAMSLFLQQSWHWSTISTGLAIAPGPAAILVASFVGQRFNERLRVGVVVAFGFFLVAVGQILMIVSLHHVHSYAKAILPGWILIGMGFGFSIPTIIGSATHDLPAELSASGSAVVNSARQIGGVFGASILVVILGSAAVTGDTTRYYDLWWLAAGLCAVAAILSLGLTPAQPPEEGDAASQTESELVDLAVGPMP